jgi:hypothetical protein
MSKRWPFPHPLNEKAARVVAGVVALAALLVLLTGWTWLLAPLALGFIARATTGPAFSPLGRFAMWFARRFLGEPKYVSGPPKRFAQAIGAVCTTAGAIAALAFDAQSFALGVAALMVVFATLESVFAFCAGCKLFGLLMRTGVVPEHVCADCADIWARPGMVRPAPRG